MSKEDDFSNMLSNITGDASLGIDKTDSLDEINEYGEVVEEVKDTSAESIKEVKEVIEDPKVKLEESTEEKVDQNEKAADSDAEDLAAEEDLLDGEIKVEDLDQPKVDEPVKYVPNLKYSVRGEEKEIPEYLKSSIVNAESETQIRDILTKVDGIEGIKESRDKAVLDGQEAQKLNTQNDEYYNSLNNLIQDKDWDNFYKHANIKEDDILDYAEEILRRRELQPAEVANIQNNANMRMENIHMEKRNNEVLNQRDEIQTRLDRMEIDNAFVNTDIAAAEKSFDERLGTAGSFKKAMAEIGQASYAPGARKLTVLEACHETIKRYGINPNTTVAPTVQKIAPKEIKTVAGVEQRTVVRDVEHIPSAKHNASKTPVKRIVKDIDDLAAVADEFLSEQ